MIFEVDEQELLSRPFWAELVKRRAGHRCERCGRDSQLHAHHLDHDPMNHRLENGRALCPLCHHQVHDATPPERPVDEEAIASRNKRALRVKRVKRLAPWSSGSSPAS